jgi:hypothetical protein
MSLADDDFEKARREVVFEQVSKVIRENPKNWAKKLEELGFQWVDDEYDEDEVEENSARPENLNQGLLVAYFDGAVKFSEQVLEAYLAERASPTPNFPLIRKYFKRGNEHLRRLLIFGLERRPTDIGLLNDLGFFHEVSSILADVIHYYLKACKEEHDMRNFEELALSFYYDTMPDDFDAFYELEQHMAPGSDKAKIVQKIRQEQALEPECVKF